MAKAHKANWVPLAFKILPCLSITFITFFAYQEILSFFFTTKDGLTLIDTCRVRSFHDIIRIFSEPLMHGTTFRPSYYRPIAVLSYSLDYAVWRMTPFGYHLTDLVLHILVSLLVYLLLLKLSNKDRLTAWLGAVIFSLHPILTQCVPGIARRQDILATAFFLASILLFLDYLHTAKKSRLLLSAVSYGFSLGSKETAIILPVVLVAYLTLVHNQTNRVAKSMKAAISTVAPYIIMTVIILAWRFYILQGLGGVTGQSELHFIAVLLRTLLVYFSDLVYGLPQTFTAIYRLVPPEMSVLIILLLIVMLVMRRHFLSHVMIDRHDWATIPGILLIFTASASLLGLLVYPLLSSSVMGLITKTYEGQGLYFLAKVMNVRSSRPVQYYFDIFTGLALTLLLICALSSIIIFGLLHHHRRTKQTIWPCSNIRLLSFFAVWLLLPLIFYTCAVVLLHRYMYFSIVPYACVISVLAFGSGKSILAKRDIRVLVHGSVLLMSMLLIASVFLYSPLVRPLNDWRQASKISSIFLHKFSTLIATAQLPDDSVIHLYHLPSAKSGVGGLSDYSIKSWLNLQGLGDKIDIIVQSRAKPDGFRKNVILEAHLDRDAREMKVNVKCI